MTAYRYVRLGELPATRRAGRWTVQRSAIETWREGHAAPPSGAGRRRPTVLRVRLSRCLLAGDEPGAWSVVERALTTGYTPSQLYLELLAPTLRDVGDRWADGDVSIGEEHAVTAVATRLVGRLGPRFVHRGRRLGTVVVGGAPGDPHALPAAMLADILRSHSFHVADLGADVPVRSFVEAATNAERLLAVAVSISDADLLDTARDVVIALADEVDAPVLVGGPVTDERTAAQLGADAWAPDGEAAAALIARLRRGR